MDRKSVTPINGLPGLDEILAANPGWLDDAITDQEAAKILGVSSNALAVRRTRGQGPAFIKDGRRCVRYTRRDCYEHLARKRVAVSV